jgi:uncharacterized membrane protein YkvI
MIRTLDGFVCFALVAVGVVMLAHGAATADTFGVAAGIIAMAGGLIRGAMLDAIHGDY